MVLSLLAIVALSSSPSAPARPHLIHILADDVGHNDVGWANERVRTPTLDALAAQGVKLSHFYTFKECAPSRGSIMTGRYPYHFGYYRNPSDEGAVPLSFKLLPALLREKAGYQTAAVGKWHVGFKTEAHTPTMRGFDSWLGYYHWGEGYFHHEFPPAYKGATKCRGVDLNNNTGATLRPFGNASAAVDGVYSMDLFVAEACRVIAAHDAAAAPLYLYLAFQNVHDPYEVPASFVDRVDPLTTDPSRRNFSAMLTALDDGVASVVDALKQAGMYENSVILWNADNGGELPYDAAKFGAGGGAGNNWPLKGGKFSLFEGGLRARAFVHSPLLPAGRVGAIFDGLAHTSDIYPTFAALAGLAPADFANSSGPFPPDGFDLSVALWGDSGGGGGAGPRAEVLHQPLNQHWNGSCSAGDLASSFQPSCGAAITAWPFKLIAGFGGDSRTLPLPDAGYRAIPSARARRAMADSLAALAGPPHARERRLLPPPAGAPCVATPCLFDLSVDPNEEYDLGALPEHAGTVAALVAKIYAYGKDGPEPAPGGDDSTTSDAECAVVDATGSWQPWEH